MRYILRYKGDDYMGKDVISEFDLGDMTLSYELDKKSGNVGMILVPTHLKKYTNIDKKYEVDSIVQLKILGDGYSGGFSQGITMRNSCSTRELKYESQTVIEEKGYKTIITVLKNNYKHELEHRVTWYHGDDAIMVYCIFKNCSESKTTIEMLSSFSLGGITPFEVGDTAKSLLVHQLRSKWSSEGRLQTSTVEELLLEPSWNNCGVYSHRFGQVGSMPVRGFFPFIAIEDTNNNVSWGAQIAYAGSWQIEVYRKDDALSISGGLADREFGHWMKQVNGGEQFETPKAIVSVTQGGIDQISQRLTSFHKKWLNNKPEIENELPVIFNEFCTTWGNPSHENIKMISQKLKGKGIKYLVIDCGWYSEEGKPWYLSMGDWNISSELFPDGLEKAVEAIRECGMVPGIWFEIENCGRESQAFNNEDHLLKRDGYVITAGDRRFWDMRDPFVIDYLSEKVIEFIKQYKFGYLKIDYNDTIGIGCDGAESLGEGLRQQIMASQNFIKKIQEQLPSLVIENCASGGHRIEPSMIAITSMSSFSDAHECVEIPIIAANLHRVILPEQNQIWAVLRKTDSAKRLYYSIINTFIGRMCLSGDIYELDESQWEIVNDGIQFYNKIRPIIKDGFSYRFGADIKSYRHPQGWQVVFRIASDKSKALAIIHTFERQIQQEIKIQIPENLNLRVESIFSEKDISPCIQNNNLYCPLEDEFEAMAVLFEVE
jgi:alpha-galactosidase